MVLGEPSGRSRVVRGDVHVARAVPLMGAQPNPTVLSEDPRDPHEDAPHPSRRPFGSQGRRRLGLSSRPVVSARYGS